jgi:hypothetical protein
MWGSTWNRAIDQRHSHSIGLAAGGDDGFEFRMGFQKKEIDNLPSVLVSNSRSNCFFFLKLKRKLTLSFLRN